MKRLLIMLSAICLLIHGCDRLPDKGSDDDNTGNAGGTQVPIDFSYVGYHRGEAQLPSVPTVMTLEAPEDGSDATAVIQNALDNVQTPGAVLLKAGEYKVSSKLAHFGYAAVALNKGARCVSSKNV